MMSREIVSYLPLIAVAFPLFSFFMIILAQQITWWRNSWSLIGSAGTLAAVVLMYPLLAGGGILVFEIPMIVTPLNLTFRVDGLSFLVALIASFI